MNSLPTHARFDPFSSEEVFSYDAIAAAMPTRYHKAHRLQNEALAAQLLGADTVPSVLEIGPGTGLDLAALRAMPHLPTFRWTGIERSVSMLYANGQSVIPRCASTVEIICADALYEATWLNLADRKFDCCVHAFVLHHYADEVRYKMHTRLLDHLKPTGLYVITDLFSRDDPTDAVAIHQAEAEDIGRTVVDAVLPNTVDRDRLRVSWMRHYLYDNQPPSLETEVAYLQSLGCQVEIALRESQVVVLLVRKES